MKKYLMFAFAALAFVGCSKSDDVSDSSRTKQSDVYAQNFVAKYGNPASNHTWGFGSNASAPAFDFTRSHWKNKNQYRDVMNVPDEPTTDEINTVTEWFTTHESPATVNVNWSDFFVWQISATENGTSHMDQLWCGASKESMEHVNDFNSGNNPDHAHVGPATFMYNSGTKEFAYQESLTDGSHTVYNHFVCIPGYIIAPNDPVISKYYYVGLDYEATGTDPNQQVARDYFYNDWIVRITPGEYKNAVRIICEDLGDTDDFDFNDVVFDAAFADGVDGGLVITLQAAGGTLPLTVGGVEVHEAFGVTVKDMVNTGRVSAPVAIFRIPFTGTRNWNKTDYNAIEVKVQGSDAQTYVLKSEIGKVPQKICVEPRYEWTSERQSIEAKYPGFKNYVGNEDSSWY